MPVYAETSRKQRRITVLDVANRHEALPVQLLCCLRANSPDALDREGSDCFACRVPLYYHEPAGLFKIAGQLSQELVWGNAERAGQPKFIFDTRLNGASNNGSFAKEILRMGHVKKCLINGDWFEQRRIGRHYV